MSLLAQIRRYYQKTLAVRSRKASGRGRTHGNYTTSPFTALVSAANTVQNNCYTFFTQKSWISLTNTVGETRCSKKIHLYPRSWKNFRTSSESVVHTLAQLPVERVLEQMLHCNEISSEVCWQSAREYPTVVILISLVLMRALTDRVITPASRSPIRSRSWSRGAVRPRASRLTSRSRCILSRGLQAWVLMIWVWKLPTFRSRAAKLFSADFSCLG